MSSINDDDVAKRIAVHDATLKNVQKHATEQKALRNVARRLPKQAQEVAAQAVLQNLAHHLKRG